jgi:hypothetical protein
LTLPISDSLSGTTSFISLRSLSTANELLEEPDEPELDELLEEPPAPAVLAPVAEPLPDEELLSEELDALLVPPPETVSPTSPESETIVPLSGASRRVSATLCSSLLTVRRSLFTAAFAEAIFASRVAVLIVAVLLEPDEEEPDDEPFPLELPELEPLLVVRFVVGVLDSLLAGAVVLGVVAAGAVVVAGVVVAAGVVVVGVVAAGAVVAGVVVATAVVARTIATDAIEALDALLEPELAEP